MASSQLRTLDLFLQRREPNNGEYNWVQRLIKESNFLIYLPLPQSTVLPPSSPGNNYPSLIVA